MNWRKFTRAFHRDLGYTAAALAMAYALSGLAVNHIDDWNPNYTFERTAVDVGPLPAAHADASGSYDASYDAMQAQVVARLAIDPGEVRGRVMDSATRFRVLLREGQEVSVDVTTGHGFARRVATRFGLYEVNLLHLNNLKGAWTYVADLFALALFTLAVTGLLMHQGRQGIAGRGKWFLAAGLAVPAIFVLYAYFGGGLAGEP